MEDIQHQQMGYDRAATMFAPNGHILQVEYAEKTIRLGSPSIGIVCKEGVVVIADRRQKDKLVVEESVNKINIIDDHVLAVSAGITSDARVLVEKARISAQQHRINFDSEPSTESIVREIADVKQQFTQYGGARPYGVSMMFAGYNGEPSLYTTDVTGNFLQYKANAIGEQDEKIKERLREEYKEGMSIKQGITLILTILKEIQKEDYDIKRLDAGIIHKQEGKGTITRISGKAIEQYN
jgi:proteasome alpha subunit